MAHQPVWAVAEPDRTEPPRKESDSLMSTTDLQDELLTMVNDKVSLDPSEPILADTDLLLTGQVDSLGVMTIVDWLERRADVRIEPADIIIDHFQTVERMLSFVATLQDPASG